LIAELPACDSLTIVISSDNFLRRGKCFKTLNLVAGGTSWWELPHFASTGFSRFGGERPLRFLTQRWRALGFAKESRRSIILHPAIFIGNRQLWLAARITSAEKANIREARQGGA
jgi:hypothetical protein